MYPLKMITLENFYTMRNVKIQYFIFHSNAVVGWRDAGFNEK